MARTINTKLKLEGEAEYKAAISGIKAEQALLKSELLAVSSQYREQANGMEALTAKSDVLQKQYDTQKNKLEILQTALEKAKEAQEKSGNAVEDYKQKIAAAEASLEEMKNSTEDTSEEQKKLTDEIEELNKGLTNAEKTQQMASNTVNEYQKQVNYAQVALDDLDVELQKNNQYLGEAENSSNKCATSIDQFGNSTEQANEQLTTLDALLSADRIQASMDRLEEYAMKAAKALLDLGGESDEASSTIVKATGATGDALDELKDIMWNVQRQIDSTDVGQTAAAIGEVNTRLDLQGEELENVTYLFIEYADATNSAVIPSIQSVTRLMHTWGVETKDTGFLLDKLTLAGQKTGVSVQTLSDSLVDSYAYLQELGFSLDGSIALLASFEKNGINSTAAIMGMKTAVKNFAQAGQDASPALQKGIEQIQTMESTSEATALAMEIFGTKAGPQLAAAIRDGRFEIDEFTAELKGSEGTLLQTADAADTMEDRWNNAINNMKADMSGFSDELYQLGLNALPVVQAALGWIANNAGLVASGIVGITTAVIAFKVATSLATIAMTAFKTAVVAADIATKATTIGLVAAAIVGVVSAIGTLVVALGGAKTAADEMLESIENLREEHEKNIQSIQDESTATLGLITTLQTLIATEGETVFGKAQINSIVSNLNESIPNLSLAYDEQTNSLNMTAQAVRDLALAEYERAKQEAQMEALTEAYKNQFQIEEQLTSAKAQLTEAEIAYNEEKSKSGPLIANTASEYNKAKSEIDKYTVALAENKELVKSLGGVVDDYSDAMDAQADANESAEASVDSLKAKLEDLQTKYEANAKACKSSFEKQMGLFDEVAKSSTTSMETIISNLEKQAAYWANYDTNFAAVMKKLESYPPEVRNAIVDNLSDGSEKSAAILAAMAEATPAQMERMVAGMDQRDKTIAAAASTMGGYVDGVAASKEQVDAQYKHATGSVALMNQKTGAYSAGADTADGFLFGLGSGKSKIEAKARELAATAVSSMKKFLGIKSPSRVTMGLGTNTAEGYILGLEKQKGSLEDAAARATDILLKAFGDNDKAKAQIAAFMDTYKEYLAGVVEEAKKYASQLEDTLDDIQSRWDNVDKQRQSMQEKLSGYGSLMGDTDKFLSEKKALSGLDQAYQKAKDSAKSSLESQMGLFKQMSATADDFHADLFAKMNSQVKFTDQYAENLQTAMEWGLDENLLKQLADGSEDSAKILDALLFDQSTVEKANEKYAKLIEGQDKLASVMATINKDDSSQLSDLQSQIDTLDKYKSSLDALKERGIADDLMQQVAEMDPDEAIAYAEELLALSDEKWEEYNTLWKEKQEKAAQIAQDYYQEELDALETEYSDQLEKGLDGLKDIAFSSGKNMVQSLIEGMKSQESALQNQANVLVNLLKGAIHGGDLSFVGSHKSGLSYVPYDDYPALLHEGERVLTKEEAQEYLYRSIPRVKEIPVAVINEEERRRTDAVVNALSTITTGIDQRNKGDMTIQMMVDGTVFARATIENFRAASDETPRVESDFV